MSHLFVSGARCTSSLQFECLESSHATGLRSTLKEAANEHRLRDAANNWLQLPSQVASLHQRIYDSTPSVAPHQLCTLLGSRVIVFLLCRVSKELQSAHTYASRRMGPPKTLDTFGKLLNTLGDEKIFLQFL